MSERTESLSEVKHELLEKVDAVDRKVDAVDRKVDAVDRKVDAVREELLEKIDGVDRKVDQTRAELSTLIAATATSLEHRMDKKLDQLEGRLKLVAEHAADAAAERVIGAVYERARYDAAVFDDRVRSVETRLEDHVSNERIHLAPGSKPR